MKAISLFSGGLDSCLSIKLIKDQGIDVIALYLDTGFGGTKDNLEHLKNMCEQVGAELKIVNIKDQFIQDVLFDPKYGYGKNFNPCIDCHANMFRVAKAMMKEWGAKFLISGEVLGQRPMSQRAEALGNVLKLANTEELLVRPLSAKLLEPTIPEKEGWIDRDKLLDISGRNREVQLKMAKDMGLTDYESPGGGCLLTDEHFSTKIEEFIKYDKLTSGDINLLKYGRHFRLPDGAKLAVGRNAEDNAGLEAIKNDKYQKIKLPIAGPFSLISKNASQNDKELAVKLAITYAKSSPDESYDIIINDDETISTNPFENKKDAQKYFFNAKS